MSTGTQSIVVHLPAQASGFIRLPKSGARCPVSGLSRTALNALVREEKIKSKSMKSRPGATRGVRLIDRESLISYINSLGEAAGEKA